MLNVRCQADGQKDPVRPFKENSGFMMTPKDLDQRTRHTIMHSSTWLMSFCHFQDYQRSSEQTHNMKCSEKAQNKWRDVAEATWKAGGQR